LDFVQSLDRANQVIEPASSVLKHFTSVKGNTCETVLPCVFNDIYHWDINSCYPSRITKMNDIMISKTYNNYSLLNATVEYYTKDFLLTYSDVISVLKHIKKTDCPYGLSLLLNNSNENWFNNQIYIFAETNEKKGKIIPFFNFQANFLFRKNYSSPLSEPFINRTFYNKALHNSCNFMNKQYLYADILEKKICFKQKSNKFRI